MANWSATASKAGKYTFDTAGKFVDRDIDFVIDAGSLSGSVSSSDASANVSVSVSNTKDGNGKYPISGSGTISGSTTGTVSPVAAHTGDTGAWISSGSTVTGTVSGTASASGTINPIGLSASGTGSATISSVTVGAKSGNTYAVTGSANITGTASASVSSTGYGVKDRETGSGSVTGTASLNATIPAASITKGTTTVGTTKDSSGNYPVTRGTYDIGAGYINASDGDLAAATFANAATSGVTYKDISETAAAPILISGKGLWINQGYVDNLYISLARLTPDKASGASAIQNGMLNTVSAYDNDGNLVTGNIVAKGASDITVSGKTVTIPAGYYSSQQTKSIADAGAATVKPTAVTTAATIGSTATDGYYTITNTIGAESTHASAGYVTTAKETGSASIQVGKVLVGSITNNTSGGTSTATITSGKQIKISKGYYHNDLYYTAQSFTQSPITGSLSSSIDSGYTAPTLVDSKATGKAYVTLSGNGSMTTGHQYNGTANAKTQYLEVYKGTYSIA